MGIWSAILGGIVGWVVGGGPIGAIIGVAIASSITDDGESLGSGDDSWSDAWRQRSTENDYRNGLLILLASVMKANGKQMVCELDAVKASIKRHYKTEREQRAALRVFRNILKQDYDLEEVCVQLRRSLRMSARYEIIQDLLEVAYADGEYERSEERIIMQIARYLWLTNSQYYSVKALFESKRDSGYYNRGGSQGSSSSGYSRGGSSYGGGGSSSGYQQRDRSSSGGYSSGYGNSGGRSGGYGSSTKDTSWAYTVLGLTESASDNEVKKRYRKLAMQYHPDKVASLGEEAQRSANETFKKINEAYEIIKQARGIN